MKTILFATSKPDAENYCANNGLDFDTEVVWVMNVQLLGEMDTRGAEIHYTKTFIEMPAYAEAVARFS